MDLIPLHKDAWIEMYHDHTVVSWPGGMRDLDNDAVLPDLLAAIALCISDLLHEYVSPAELRREKSKARDEGFDAGWKAKHPVSSASA